jgi:hypothetical protein
MEPTCELQKYGFSLLVSPEQSRPLNEGLGLVHDRVSILTPLPHDLVQEPNADQSVNPPSVPEKYIHTIDIKYS